MEVLNNADGYPMMAFGQTVFFEIENKVSDGMTKRDILQPHNLNEENYIMWGDYKIMAWGKNNEFPQKADEIISSTSVLNTGLKFLRQLTVGQGIFPCTVEGYDDKGNEILQPVKDKNVIEICSSRMVRRYLEKASRDYFKFGCANVLLSPNAKGEIVGLQVLNSLFTRYTLPDASGSYKTIVSGCFPGSPGIDDDVPKVFNTLNDYDPELAIRIKNSAGRIDKAVVMSIKDSWSNNDFYSEPVWLPAYRLGWVDIARQVPVFLKKAYENQITWKWHVKIPYSYWEKRFPKDDPRYDTAEKRRIAINHEMDSFERNLCGADNAEKPLMTHYSTNEANGRIEEEWKIESLDNKYKGGENLVTSAAANSEILFSLMINPNVLGAMPSGNYGSNQGGSNIREAFLVNIANAWLDRQNLLDPVYLLLKSRGYDAPQIRFRNTILTTLDTGAGTKKTLS